MNLVRRAAPLFLSLCAAKSLITADAPSDGSSVQVLFDGVVTLGNLLGLQVPPSMQRPAAAAESMCTLLILATVRGSLFSESATARGALLSESATVCEAFNLSRLDIGHHSWGLDVGHRSQGLDVGFRSRGLDVGHRSRGLDVGLDLEQLAWLTSAPSNATLGRLCLSGLHVLGPRPVRGRAADLLDVVRLLDVGRHLDGLLVCVPECVCRSGSPSCLQRTREYHALVAVASTPQSLAP